MAAQRSLQDALWNFVEAEFGVTALEDPRPAAAVEQLKELLRRRSVRAASPVKFEVRDRPCWSKDDAAYRQVLASCTVATLPLVKTKRYLSAFFTHLSLNKSRITCIGPSTASLMANLRELTLSENRLTELPLALLPSRLESLNAYSCEIESLGPVEVGCPLFLGLNHLGLGFNPLPSIPALKRWAPRLQSLDLSFCDISDLRGLLDGMLPPLDSRAQAAAASAGLPPRALKHLQLNLSPCALVADYPLTVLRTMQTVVALDDHVIKAEHRALTSLPSQQDPPHGSQVLLRLHFRQIAGMLGPDDVHEAIGWSPEAICAMEAPVVDSVVPAAKGKLPAGGTSRSSLVAPAAADPLPAQAVDAAAAALARCSAAAARTRRYRLVVYVPQPPSMAGDADKSEATGGDFGTPDKDGELEYPSNRTLPSAVLWAASPPVLFPPQLNVLDRSDQIGIVSDVPAALAGTGAGTGSKSTGKGATSRRGSAEVLPVPDAVSAATLTQTPALPPPHCIAFGTSAITAPTDSEAAATADSGRTAHVALSLPATAALRNGLRWCPAVVQLHEWSEPPAPTGAAAIVIAATAAANEAAACDGAHSGGGWRVIAQGLAPLTELLEAPLRPSVSVDISASMRVVALPAGIATAVHDCVNAALQYAERAAVHAAAVAKSEAEAAAAESTGAGGRKSGSSGAAKGSVAGAAENASSRPPALPAPAGKLLVEADRDRLLSEWKAKLSRELQARASIDRVVYRAAGTL